MGVRALPLSVLHAMCIAKSAADGVSGLLTGFQPPHPVPSQLQPDPSLPVGGWVRPLRCGSCGVLALGMFVRTAHPLGTYPSRDLPPRYPAETQWG